MIIAGGLTFTFLSVLRNMKIGNSIFDEEGSKIINDIMKKAEEKSVKIHFPSDFVSSEKREETADSKIFDVESGIPDGWAGYDIGPASVESFTKIISNAKTIVWNGPPGMFELSPFKNGSIGIINALVSSTKNGALSIVGGGESVSSLKLVPGSYDVLSHVSTGGGASLELLEGKKLPGVVYLSDKSGNLWII